MSAWLLFTGYAVTVVVNGYIIGFLTKDEDALPYFFIPVLSGPLMLALVLPFIALQVFVRLGARR